VCVCVCVLLSLQGSDSVEALPRQRMNTHATIEELSDASFSMTSVSYQKKIGGWSSQNFLINLKAFQAGRCICFVSESTLTCPSRRFHPPPSPDTHICCERLSNIEKHLEHSSFRSVWTCRGFCKRYNRQRRRKHVMSVSPPLPPVAQLTPSPHPLNTKSRHNNQPLTSHWSFSCDRKQWNPPAVTQQISTGNPISLATEKCGLATGVGGGLIV
jgi:hypothetical protein